MRPLDDHLDAHELVGFPDFAEAEAFGNEDLSQLLRHLQICEACASLARNHRALRDLHTGSRPETGSVACHPEEVWLEVATGLRSAEEQPQLILHAATCQRCAVLLQEAIELMKLGAPGSFADAAESLASSSPQWQKEMAVRLRASSNLPPAAPMKGAENPRVWRWPTILSPEMSWSMLGFSALILLFASVLFLRRGQDPLERTNDLIAQAYKERRTVDLRMPGIPYGPLRVTRGGSGSRSDFPPALLQAEALIASQGTRGNPSAQWVLASAKADLLEGDYDHAVHSLERAASDVPHLPEVDLVLSAAFFERAKLNSASADYGRAVEIISSLLDKDPDNRVGVFDRAMIYQRIGLFGEAEKDWQHYLKLEPTGPWSEEAKDHLAETERVLKAKDKASNGRTIFAAGVIGGDTPTPVSDTAVNDQIEDYQMKVLTQWLPNLLRSQVSTSTVHPTALGIAIRRVAELSATKHGDLFLRELLLARPLSNGLMLRPVEDLSAAIVANQSGDGQHALKFARRAQQEFRQTGNRAGVLRSQFEIAYSMQFASQTEPCIRTAIELEKEASQKRFAWLVGQAQIEAAFCANMKGDLATAFDKLRRASMNASASNYEETASRALLGNAAMQMESGSDLVCWQLALEGLNNFWTTSLPNKRGESLFDLLELMAEQKQQWHLQHALLLESLALLEHEADRLPAARLLVRLAGNELILGRPDAARTKTTTALAIFRAAPQTPSTLSQELIVSISLAKAEVLSHDYLEAIMHLQALRPQVGELSETLSSLDFYSVLGEAYRKLGRAVEAERADRAAIDIFRGALSTLTRARDRLTWYEQVSPAYRSLVQLHLDQDDGAGASRMWEDYRRAMVSVSGSGREAEHDRAAQRFSNQTTLVYANLPEGPFAWAVSDNYLKVIKLGESYEAVGKLGNVFAAQCATPTSPIGELTANGKALFDALIAPLLAPIPVNHSLIIEPDEEFANIPFGALIAHDGHYLNEDYAIALSPPSAAQTSLKSKLARFTDLDAALLVESDSAMDYRHPEDPRADAEIHAITAIFHHSKLLDPLPPGDVKAQFGKLLSQAAIFHYAGHAGTASNGGALMLSERGSGAKDQEVFLRSQDIEPRWLTHCKLAVLSACRTNQGQSGRWLDRDNLAIAFLYAGVPEVVASRWDIDSTATATLMKAFYGNLIQGSSATESLRAAAESTRLTIGYEHPYYWSGFSVIRSDPNS